MVPMKTNYLIIIIFFSLFFNTIIGQERIHLDIDGDTISKPSFQEKWRNKNNAFIRWDSLGTKQQRFCKLKKGLHQIGNLDFNLIKKKLESISKSQIIDSSIILIEYYYKDDLCSSTRDNTWTRTEINQRKSFLNPIKKELNNKNITLVCLFEKGMLLKNKSNSEKEYFFIDEDNYFRSNLFTNRTLCGSYALIKPNGETLIRNGEYRPDTFAQYTKEENWSLFFKPSNKTNSEEN